jgi:hypothetical protein
MVEIIKSPTGRRGGTRAFGFCMLVDQGKCDVNGQGAPAPDRHEMKLANRRAGTLS